MLENSQTPSDKSLYTQGNGEKKYYLMQNVGKAKYTINTHDGVQTHKDGSPFYGIDIFSNKKKFEKAEKELIHQGYKMRGWNE